MKGIRFQLKNILKDKFCLMTFLLPIIAAAGLNFMGSIDLSDMGRFYFGIVENDLPAETAAWLEQYGSVTICDTDEALIAAVKEPSTNVIGVKFFPDLVFRIVKQMSFLIFISLYWRIDCHRKPVPIDPPAFSDLAALFQAADIFFRH